MIPDDGLTPEQREQLAKSRYHTLVLVQFVGVLLMILGMWIWAGDILREGGWPLAGAPLVVIGAFESLLLPKLLAKRWRSPREP
ncbi:MAG: hypothetical protein H7X93_04480 [Sphingomonadaceae bacterium]|nr:hypothetical protein [Sphingomonadaceae bacterium]